MSMIITIILVVFSFGLLIFGHELGHFLLAKANGVKVQEFALGMGPVIAKINGKETMYSLRILPIGGYVKMLGEYDDNEESIDESEKSRSYTFQSPLRKISIILAGPIMNFILAFVILFGIALFNGYSSTTIVEVSKDSPAERAGIQPGDEVIKLNNKDFMNWGDFVYKLQNIDREDDLIITVLRDGKELPIPVLPEYSGNGVVVGIRSTHLENVGFWNSVVYGFEETIVQTKEIISSLFKLITGKASFKDLGGPITIFKASGQAAQLGFSKLMDFTAFLSINLGVFNLIPFPALDGGSFIVNVLELITKKRIKQEILAKINLVGFSLLILLMIAVTVKDIFFPI